MNDTLWTSHGAAEIGVAYGDGFLTYSIRIHERVYDSANQAGYRRICEIVRLAKEIGVIPEDDWHGEYKKTLES